MIKILLLSILCLTNLSFARVQTGQPIKAEQFNNMSFQIGDIKHSLLTLEQFQQKHGTCWALLNGGNISGTDLGSFTGMTQLPDASGRFLRNAGGNAAPLKQLQEDELKQHDHSLFGTRNRVGDYAVAAGPHPIDFFTPEVSGAFGGVETRPKNLTVNMFVKVNEVCN